MLRLLRGAADRFTSGDVSSTTASARSRPAPDPATDPTLVEPGTGRSSIPPLAASSSTRRRARSFGLIRGGSGSSPDSASRLRSSSLVLWLMERDDSGKDVPSFVGLQFDAGPGSRGGRRVHAEDGSPGFVPARPESSSIRRRSRARISRRARRSWRSSRAVNSRCTVPRVVGTQLSAAERLLTDLGLQPTNENVQSTRPKGFVRRTGPDGRDEGRQGIDRDASRLERRGPGQGPGGRGHESERRRARRSSAPSLVARGDPGSRPRRRKAR